MFLTHAANALVHVLLAPACAGCRRPLRHPIAGAICDTCWTSVLPITPPYCVRCGDSLPSIRAGPLCPRCARRPPSFALARSMGRYDGSLRDLLHALKYQGRRALATPLGRRLRIAGHDLLADAEAVVPVPLHPWRRLQRGFNQADDLARELGLPVWRALKRTRHGPPQASLPAAMRHRNVLAAFRFKPPLRSPPPHIVVLIDDVMTTGATMEACSRTLMEGGVRSVRVLTVARAATLPRPEPPG